MNQVPRTEGPPCLDVQPKTRGDGAAGELQRIVGSIGLKVFSLRKRMGLSLQQLGERSDVSAAAIHKIEQGGMVPTITTLLKIAGALAGRSPTSWRKTSAATTWPCSPRLTRTGRCTPRTRASP